MRRFSLVLAVAFFGIASLARATFMDMRVKIPVDRVVANVEFWIKEKPQDAQAYYVLGRIHAMAWAYGPNLSLWKTSGRPNATAPAEADPFNGQLPGFEPYDNIQVRRDAQKQQVTADDIRHLQESVKNYTKAIELDPKNALCELGLAWILQETGKVSRNLPEGFGETADIKVTDAQKASYDAAIKRLGDSDAKVRDDAQALLLAALPKPLPQLKAVKTTDAEVAARVDILLSAYWDLKALVHYRKAYALRINEELKKEYRSAMPANSALALEAGEAILTVLKTLPQAAEGTEAKDIAANLDTLRKKPSGPITPIVFAMPGTPAPQRMGDLEDTSKRVTFDLAGDNVQRQWTWLKDGTALLVWDPARTGSIVNGRQLFGSRTWWVFFRNGYEALSVLDDNRDGRLTGDELEGIAVWIDRNGDAVSQPGEVVSLEQAQITGISVRAALDTFGTLGSDAGITFSDGRTAKSFDWVTAPVEATVSVAER